MRKTLSESAFVVLLRRNRCAEALKPFDRYLGIDAPHV
jgi:hypothetical protein